MIKYICTSCDLVIPRSDLLEQICHDSDGSHYFIFICPSCRSEVEEVDADDGEK